MYKFIPYLYNIERESDIMVYLLVDGNSPRKYTDAFYEYLLECGYIQEDNALNNLLWWLSDDDVEEYARVNFDVRFIESEDEIDEDEDSEYVVL